MSFYKDIAPAGSPLYYSVRTLKLKEREEVLAVYAFYKEIENITLSYSDIHIAHTKLQWWRGEIIKIQEGKATHPLAQRLPKIIVSELLEILAGLEQNLTCPEFESFEDVFIHFMRTAGKREEAIYSLLSTETQNLMTAETLYQIAFVIEFTHYLQHLRQYVRRGLFYFPQTELRQFKVTEAKLRTYQTDSDIVNLLKFQAEKINKAYQVILEANSNYFIPRNQFVQCKMAIAELSAIEKQGYLVLEKYIDLSPLKYWWLSI